METPSASTCHHCGGSTSQVGHTPASPSRFAEVLLAYHGDTTERELARRVLPDIPAYEEFWREFIVPLSFRTPEDPWFYFIRPTQHRSPLKLADASYGCLFHLVACHDWVDRLADMSHESRHATTAGLFCLFGHAGAMLYAANTLAKAVNEALDYDRKVGNLPTDHSMPSFKLEPQGKSGQLWAVPCCPLSRLGPFADLCTAVRDYRNSLVHEKLLFVQNGLLPKAHHEGHQTTGSHLDWFSGLAAMGRAARSHLILRECFEPVGAILPRLALQMRQGLNSVWASALTFLGPIRDRYHARNDPKRWDARDRDLTIDDFVAVREYEPSAE